MVDFEPLPPHPSHQLLPEKTELGIVHLDVTDAQRARLFWQNYVGLELLSEDETRMLFGVSGTPLIALYPGATTPVAPQAVGLYHVAIHVPTQKELARIAARLYGLKWEHAPTDHTETMATYFHDPDGNGIEITYETPERGNLARESQRLVAVLADGTMRSGTEPLDVDELLSHLSDDDDLMQGMPEGTRIGHIHQHVNDLEAARGFYINAIGLGDMRHLESIRMSDFSLASSFVPHALAVNTWKGTRATPRPAGSSGLRYWELRVPTESDLALISARLGECDVEHLLSENVLSVEDPAGNTLHIIAEIN